MTVMRIWGLASLAMAQTATLCAEGAAICVAGSLSCSDATGDDLDICDGVDNDCDGASADGDEDPGLGVACDGGRQRPMHRRHHGMHRRLAGSAPWVQTTTTSATAWTTTATVQPPTAPASQPTAIPVMAATRTSARRASWCAQGPPWFAMTPPETRWRGLGVTRRVRILSTTTAMGPTDVADPGCGNNTPPLAQISVSPAAGRLGASFIASAASTSDFEDIAAALVYDWDWHNDGTFEVLNEISPPAFQYSAIGTYQAVLRVTDTGGFSAYAFFEVVVTAASDLLTVTTDNDEEDVGATPATPLEAVSPCVKRSTTPTRPVASRLFLCLPI